MTTAHPNRHLSLFRINAETTVSWYLFMLAGSTLIGFFFWLIRIDDLGFRYHMLAAYCHGLISTTAVLGTLYLANPVSPGRRLKVILASVFFGAAASVLISHSLLRQGNIYISLMFTVMIQSMVFGFAFYWEMVTKAEADLEQERINRIRMNRKVDEARLKMLQAQIEPHFLFNTLSNILTLFDKDLEKGKAMQRDLIRYLDASFSKFRKEFSTIGEEMEMVTAYLNIFKVRMGERLLFFTDIPGHLKEIPFPPMLIQPLVENAIKHGLEPKIEGGAIFIRVEQTDHTLRTIVSDTGLGFGENIGMNTGLTNISERLKLLYGEAGRLVLNENHHTGLTAIIEVPHGKN